MEAILLQDIMLLASVFKHNPEQAQAHLEQFDQLRAKDFKKSLVELRNLMDTLDAEQLIHPTDVFDYIAGM